LTDIEELMRAALQAGKFDNLPGKGKPLKLDENPHANPEWRTAYHILHGAGFTLPWIETRNEIETELEKARNDLQRAWNWRKTSTAQTQSSASLEEEWRSALDAFREKVTALNKRIVDYNLTVPSDRFQMRGLNYEREVSAVTGSQTR
jgi:DnaJ homolog subfamily C member 28